MKNHQEGVPIFPHATSMVLYSLLLISDDHVFH
jgi:hypothetical protein